MFNTRLTNPAERSHIAIEIIGWVGVALILLAYILVSFNVIDAHRGLYQILNLVGALGVVIHSISKKDYQPAILNAIWVLIAVFALLSLIK